MRDLNLVRAAAEAELRAREATQEAKKADARATAAEAQAASAKQEVAKAHEQVRSARAAAADATAEAKTAKQAQAHAVTQVHAAEATAVTAERARVEAVARADAAEAATVTFEAVAMRVVEQAAEQAAKDRATTFAEIRDVIHERRVAEQDAYVARTNDEAALRSVMGTNLDVTRQCLSAVENLRGDIAVKALARQSNTPKTSTAKPRRATSSAAT
jgi:colicin import membrane protein